AAVAEDGAAVELADDEAVAVRLSPVPDLRRGRHDLGEAALGDEAPAGPHAAVEEEGEVPAEVGGGGNDRTVSRAVLDPRGGNERIASALWAVVVERHVTSRQVHAIGVGELRRRVSHAERGEEPLLYGVRIALVG